EPDFFAIVQHDRDGHEVFSSRAVGDGVGTAGIIGNHGAGGATRVSRGIRAVGYAVLRAGNAQGNTDDARFHGGGAVLDIDIEDAVEVARGINNQPRAQRISGDRGPSAAGDN